jgi:hypothetical protein
MQNEKYEMEQLDELTEAVNAPTVLMNNRI